MKIILVRALILWAVVSLAYFNWQSVFRLHSFLVIFPDIMLLVGIPFWVHREAVKKKIQEYKLSSIKKFFLLAYGIMLFQKMLAVIVNEFDDERGFSFTLLLLHVGQSWLFNIFVFAGVITGLFVILRKGILSVRESLPLIGFLALFIEKVLPYLFVKPVLFFMLAPTTVLQYFLIFIPAIYALGALPDKRDESRKKRFLLATGVVFLCALIPLFILGKLSVHFPGLFPAT